MDRGRLQVVCALASLGEAHHGYEWRDVPKKDESMGTPWHHTQVLHLVSMPDHWTHGRPCALWVVVDQMVDDHVCCHTGNQRDWQDCCLATEPIAQHRPTKNQNRALQGLVDRYVQSQGHHRHWWRQEGHWKQVLHQQGLVHWTPAHHWAR